MFSLPNCLSLLRIAMAPLLLLAAWHDRPRLFLGFFIAALLSDAVDGLIARRLQQITPLGGRLDSWGDFVLFCTTPLAVWWLWPELILEELPAVALAIMGFLVPIAVGFAKFRRLTSYHTWGAKTASVALGIATPLLLLGGPVVPFRLAVAILLLSAVDELAITLILPDWQPDIRSCWHAWQLRQAGR